MRKLVKVEAGQRWLWKPDGLEIELVDAGDGRFFRKWLTGDGLAGKTGDVRWDAREITSLGELIADATPVTPPKPQVRECDRCGIPISSKTLCPPCDAALEKAYGPKVPVYGRMVGEMRAQDG